MIKSAWDRQMGKKARAAVHAAAAEPLVLQAKSADAKASYGFS